MLGSQDCTVWLWVSFFSILRFVCSKRSLAFGVRIFLIGELEIIIIRHIFKLKHAHVMNSQTTYESQNRSSVYHSLDYMFLGLGVLRIVLLRMACMALEDGMHGSPRPACM